MWNFAVMKSGFGDYWIGRTKLEPNGRSIFSTWDEAVQAAIALNDSVENLRELEDALEDEAEEISEEMETWMI